MRPGARAAIALAATALGLAFATPAHAVDIIESQEPGGEPETAKAGWQAGTCTTDPCSAETPELFFTQAAGHPPDGFTQIIVKHSGPFEEPAGNLKTVLVDLPPGLSVNPQATPQCELEEGKFPSGGCPANTQVGTSAVTASTGVPPVTLPPITIPGLAVYNLVPRSGEPARFGFTLPLGLGEVFLNAGVDWNGNYHEYFTIHVPSVAGIRILKNRLVFNGTIGNNGLPGETGGAFLTNPSTCFNPEVEPFKGQYTTYLHADSVEEPAPEDGYDLTVPAPPSAAFLTGSQELKSPLPKGAKPEHCDKVPFAPSTSMDPGTTQTDSPTGPTVNVNVPFEPSAPIYDSNVREARVTLPEGMGINPSAAKGLGACTDAQFGEGTRNPISCPPASKIGTVAINTPPLPNGTLTGDVYLGQQLSRNPASGDEYRIFIDAESASRGLSIRLTGNISANPQTGQLTATVNEAPQLPFDSVQIKLDGGSTATLTSPPTCGPNATSHAMSAWSGTPDAGPSDKGFTLASAPGGGACAKTLAERPFTPGFAAKTTNPNGGAYSQFNVNVTRSGGSQELKGVNVLLPPGMTAKLAGVSYCPESAIAAAAAASGVTEAAKSSCPDNSLIGSATIDAGSGPSPLQIAGKVFLAGPYNEAPLSLVVVTPATAGPFDLGTVVVRVALRVNPETAQVEADSDPIPHVFGGALLDLDSISVHLDRKQFALNPTNCASMAVTGTLRGGGSDPTNPAAFSSDPVSTPFQVGGCEKLGFQPKLHLRLFGGTRRAQSPKLRAILITREGDANIARAAVGLPHALFLKQSSLSKICTRVQFAANACPQESIYGFARAFTPLLAKPLEGPVYLRSSTNPLPDLVAALGGQVDIDLVGRIDSAHGGIRTTFETVPDVPVSKFILTMRGGGKGLLVNSRNLCRPAVKAIVKIKAQNGKKANRRELLRTPCRRKQHRRPHRQERPRG
ncbi:MAG: hypothetical protein WB507_04815 [Solirubrobacterales bacterium]